MVERALRMRKYKPMFMVDIAVPRDIEPEVAQLADVYLYCIDDLQSMVEDNKISRAGAAVEAEQIVTMQADDYMAWIVAQEHIDVINRLRITQEQHRDKSLLEALDNLKMGQDPAEVVQRLSRILTNRLLHAPTVKLRQASFNNDIKALEFIKNIYDI